MFPNGNKQKLMGIKVNKINKITPIGNILKGD